MTVIPGTNDPDEYIEDRVERIDSDRIRRLEIRSAAFDLFTSLMKQIDAARGEKEIHEMSRRVGELATLLHERIAF